MQTESAIDPGLARDLYGALGEPVGGRRLGAARVRETFVRWIWLGGLLMMVGGFLAAADRRFPRRQGSANRCRSGAVAGAPATAEASA